MKMGQHGQLAINSNNKQSSHCCNKRYPHPSTHTRSMMEVDHVIMDKELLSSPQKSTDGGLSLLTSLGAVDVLGGGGRIRCNSASSSSSISNCSSAYNFDCYDKDDENDVGVCGGDKFENTKLPPTTQQRPQQQQSDGDYHNCDNNDIKTKTLCHYDHDQLQEISAKIVRKLPIKDRTYRFRKYKNCFVASEVVDIMLRENLVTTREEGVNLGIQLQKRCNLWSHVVDDHTFGDKYLFFRLTKDQNPSQQQSSTDTSSSTNSTTTTKRRGSSSYRRRMSKGKQQPPPPPQQQQQQQNEEDGTTTISPEGHEEYYIELKEEEDNYKKSAIGISSCDNEDEDEGCNTSLPSYLPKDQLRDLAVKIIGGLEIKNRKYHLRTYKRCFVASEVVDLMIMQQLVSTREDAVALGVALQTELNLWHHVVDNHLFSDQYLFFRLTSDNDHQLNLTRTNEEYVDMESSALSLSSEADDHPSNQCSSDTETKRMSFTKRCSFDSASSGAASTLSDTEFDAISVRLLEGLDIQTRTYRFKKYRKCFVASEAIDYMMEEGIVTSRKEGVALGRALQMKRNFWQHVVDDHLFGDAYLFFRLTKDENHGRRSSRSSTASIISNSTYYDSSSGDERSVSTSDVASERLTTIQELLKAREGRKSHKPHQRNNRRLQLEGSSCHSSERKVLRHAFKKAKDDACPHLALIGGVSGCGKTMLVRSAFQEEIKSTDCLFATTKFDQDEMKHTTPFRAIRELLSDLFKQAESTTPALYAKFKRSIVDAFEDTPTLCQALGRLLTEEQSCLLSMMEGMFGKEGVEEAENIFHSAISEPLADDAIKCAINVFFKAVSSVSSVILSFDDIMWIDDFSLDVIRALLLNSEIHRLFIVATFRDNEVDDSHPLFVWRSSIEANPLLLGSLHSISLSNLTLLPLQELLSKSLRVDEDDVGELAKLLFERTHGNLFYLVQLLGSLQDMSVLSYNEMEFRWSFSVDRLVERTTLSENVGQLVCSRITSLPPDVQEILKFASCFGSRVDADILEIAKAAMTEHVEDIHKCLQYACDEQMLLRMSDSHYKFSHEQIQTSALSMISADGFDDLIDARWRITKLLLSHPAVLEEDDLTFACADQALASATLVDNDYDRFRIAKLSLVAGTRATQMSAFAPASTYLSMGVKVLGGHKAFATHYQLAIELHILLARAAYSCGQTEVSQEVAETAVKYSMTWEDKMTPLMTVFRCLLSKFDYKMCLTYGLDLVKTLGGEPIQRNPTALQAGIERKRVQVVLKEYTDNDILNLPPMDDKNKERCMSVLVKLLDVSRQLNENVLLELIYYRCLWMTLKDGLSKLTPVALFSAAQLSIGRDHDINEGARFSRLAEKMLYLSPGGTAHYLVAIVKGVVDPSRQHLDLCMAG